MRSRSKAVDILVLLLLPAFLLWPVETTPQSFSGLSFCLDPGHGAGNVNQGPTGLYEYDINMKVVNFLKDYLYRVHADTVILTRANNSTDPSLSQREDIANQNAVDWFH